MQHAKSTQSHHLRKRRISDLNAASEECNLACLRRLQCSTLKRVYQQQKINNGNTQKTDLKRRCRLLTTINRLALSISEIVATQDMCAWCFALISYKLHGSNNCPQEYQTPSFCRRPSAPQTVTFWKSKDVKVPMFVSWMLKENNVSWDTRPSVSLRGCIGSLDPVPIEDIEQYCFKAAFHDKRFAPLSKNEIPNLECHVSLLNRFEVCAHPYDWDIRDNGVIIKFSRRNSVTGCHDWFQATFLPGVALQNRFTQEETLLHLIRKAGWRGKLDDDLLKTLCVTKYQASKSALSFDQYAKRYASFFLWK